MIGAAGARLARGLQIVLIVAGCARAHAQGAMNARDMAAQMQMDDTGYFGKVILDQLEWRDGGAGQPRAAWDAQAWYGGDYDKLWMKTEGNFIAGSPDRGVHEATAELFWDRVVSRWWNLQLGARESFGTGPSRTWLAAGLQGLAPQWIQTEATVYASDAGHTAARIKTQYDLLLTQRLIVQPYLEANLYGRSDPGEQTGSGLSDLQISVRLRYELRRELAPYIGLVWLRRFGSAANLARAAGSDPTAWGLTAGLRAWF